MRKRRGISSIVGAVFFVIVMTIMIGYIAYSMDTLDNFVQTVIVKSSIRQDTVNEEFVVSKVTLDNNKFNITVSNPGNIPVKLTRLWVVNKTDTDWVARYDLNEVILSEQTVTNIGQNIPLSALETASYSMKFVTERGNSQNLFVNSIGEESLYLKLRANPEKIATDFNSIISLQVINNGTSTLRNLKPEMDSVTTPVCSALCSYEQKSGADPASYDKLEPGDSATFQWIYEIKGDKGDTVSFSASLVNGIDEVSTSVTVGNVLLAEQAGVALEAVGLGKSSLTSDILLFHQETALTPNSKYQMYSGAVDGGTDGTLIQMESTTPNFFTQNTNSPITVPAGLWTASLQLQSEAMPQTLIAVDEAMIFHFEDGSLQDPDNSEGSAARDLEGCSLSILFEDDFTRADSNTVGNSWSETDGGSGDEARIFSNKLKFDTDDNTNTPYVSHTFTKQTSGKITWTFELHIVRSGGEGTFEVFMQLGDSALMVAPTTNPATGVAVNTKWGDNGNGFTNDAAIGTVDGTDTQIGVVNDQSDDGVVNIEIIADLDADTYDITVTGPGLQSGTGTATNVAFDNAVDIDTVRFILDALSSGSVTVKEFDDVKITKGSGGVGGTPAFQAGTGPHGSGSYYYDGVNDCFKSTNDVIIADENHIGTNDVSTSLWFKTDGAVTSEQYLAFWAGDGTCPSCDYYKISLNSVGKVLYEYNLNNGGSSTTTCLSTNEYDDDIWYHVIGTRDASDDDCTLYITKLDGSDAESPIVHNPDYGDSSVDVTGKWYVGSNKAENGNWFKGWIDDIVHWNSLELDSAETDDISKVNYGTGAHQFDITLDLTDKDGNFISNVYSASGTSIAFQDSKALGDNNDAGYGIHNVTFNLPQVVVPISQRLNFSMNFVPSTSTWEALDVDMKIDDITMTPYSSFLQIPIPDKSFPSYFIHDNDNEIDTFVSFAGTSGIYMTVKGTRIAFNGTAGEGSFAAMIKSVNGTLPAYDVLSTKDSIYIPSGSKAQLYFYMPTDHPSVQPPTEGTVIIPGNYDASVWLHGYTDLGETFSKTIKLGNVLVVE